MRVRGENPKYPESFDSLLFTFVSVSFAIS
jgi:hypothetical protein